MLPSAHHLVVYMATAMVVPKLVVFDLDATVWRPELYQLRRQPTAGKEVKLLDGAAAALKELATDEKWANTKVAVASRTNKGDWARTLLEEFEVPGTNPPMRLAELISYQEIYTGSKVQHFGSLRSRSGIPYDEMLFFDDALGGKYGNCEPVAGLGVCAAWCPDGITNEVWSDAVNAFTQLKAAGENVGRVLRPQPASKTPSFDAAPRAARVLNWKEDKGFGFVKVVDGSAGVAEMRSVFFHRSALLPSGGAPPAAGEDVRVVLGMDSRGRLECTSVARAATAATDNTAETVTLQCFSMNMPFAALVAHGQKTLETRNHTMFEGTDGAIALLHVGQRTYPDGGKHKAILARAGVGPDELERLTSLPAPHTRGAVVALLELGPTNLASLEERSEVAIESAACAYGGDMGRYLTKVRRAVWLDEPVPMKGRPGLFKVQVPVSALPDVPWAAGAVPRARSA